MSAFQRIPLSTCLLFHQVSLQALCSGSHPFPLLLTTADRPFEILGHYSNQMLFDNWTFRNFSPDFSRFLKFLRALAAASRVNFNCQTLFWSLVLL